MGPEGATVECSSCGELAPEAATWCEACGHELAVVASAPCPACGETSISPDGYCLTCGQRQPRERDHLVLVDGPVAAVSDRGRRHHDNEDAVAIGRAGPAAVLVVCDGVSSTPGSAEASSRAATAARDVLVDGLDGLDGGAEVDVPGLLVAAVEAAQREATTAAEDVAAGDGTGAEGVWVGDGPPSSTLVAVVAVPAAGGTGTELSTAWVGDSRAYWIALDGAEGADGADGARRLTGDDHALAGSLIRWLGADSIDPAAEVDTATVTGTGHVVVCSDGLWRYAAETGDLAALVSDLIGRGRRGAELAEALVEHANGQGGHDNITVALWSNVPAALRSDIPAALRSDPAVDNAEDPKGEP